MPTNKVEIEIAARASGFQAEFERLSKEAQGAAGRIKSAFNFASATVAGLGLGVLISALNEIKEKTIDGERSLNQLNAVLKATGGSAGITAASLERIGKSIQGSTVFDDDEIRKASTALLRFRTIQGDVFEQALRLAPDVAAALGTDLPNAAEALGKALTDPEGGMKALKAAGVSLSDQQKDLAARFIEAGDKASAQRIVIEELAKSVGGAAGADNTGLYGASKRLTRSWDDLQKALGKHTTADFERYSGKLGAGLDALTERVEKTKTSWFDLATMFAQFLNPQLAAAADIIGSMQKQQRDPNRSASGLISIGGLDPREAEAADRAREQSLKQREDALYNAQQAALKRRADAVSANYAAILDQTKGYLDADAALYQSAYQRGEIAGQQFFDKQRAQAIALAKTVNEGLIARGDALLALSKSPKTSAEDQIALDADAVKVMNGQRQVQIDLAKQLSAIDTAEADAVAKLNDEYAQLNTKLIELNGTSAEAAAASFDLQNKALATRAAVEAANGSAASQDRARAIQEALAQLKQQIVEQARLTDATRDYSTSLGFVGVAENRIATLRESGALTELESLRAVSEVRAASLVQLQKELVIVEQLAAASGRREDVLHAQELRAEFERLAATGDLVAKKFNEIGASAFTDFLTDIVTRMKTVSQAFQDLGKNLASTISRIAAQNLAEKLFGQGGAASGFGDLLSKLFGGGSGAAGAGGAAALTASQTALAGTTTTLTAQFAVLTASVTATAAALAAMGASSATSAATSLFSAWGGGAGVGFGFAGGTNFAPGGMAIVGERGPELVKLPRGSQVVPNHRMADYRGGEIHVHVSPPPGMSRQSSQQFAVQIGTDISRRLKRA